MDRVKNKFIYLHVPKTGGTFIEKQIYDLGIGTSIGPTHATLREIPNKKNLITVTSVRNPWEWYVSLWSFRRSYRERCAKEGKGLSHRVFQILYYDFY